MHKSYQFRLYPNQKQKQFLAHHFGATRYIYNLFLSFKKEIYQNGKIRTSYIDDAKLLTQIKKQKEYYWLNNINAQTLQVSLKHLDEAYGNFFKKKAKFPHFHKRSNEQCIKIPQAFKIKNNKLHIPKLKTGIKIKLHREIEGKILSVHIRKTATNKYYASFTCEVTDLEPLSKNANVIGFDLGIKTLLVSSTGETFHNPKLYQKAQKKLAYNQRQVSKKKKGSNNQKKQRKIVALIHEKIKHQRKDNLHKISKKIINENQVIIAETLNVAGMVQNHCLAKSISDCSFGTFLQLLEYKASWYGRTFHAIDQWFPSSKTCNCCGFIMEELPLHIREWQCSHCHSINDRDLNAAKNIRDQGLKELKTLSGSGIDSDIKQKLGEAFSLEKSLSQEVNSCKNK